MDLLLLDSASTQPTTIDSSREQSKSTTTLESDPVLKDYLDCFSNKPGMLSSKVHLEVDSAVTPVVHPPRKIPVSMLDLARQKLREMEKDGIIVKEEEHTPWVSLMLVKGKEKKKPPTKDNIRLCIDPRDLNRALKRPHYPMATVEQVANKLTGAQIFSTLDACRGFTYSHDFDISSTPEIYQREMDRIFAEVPVEIIVDDFLIHGGNQHELDDKMIAVLKRSREIGLKFNPHKAKRVPEVSYVGQLFTADGLKPDPEKVKAIKKMPAPTDKDGILRFLGTVNYLDKFIEHKADLQAPRNDTAFVWETPQQQAFDKLKSVIISGPVLPYFDNTNETVLNVDASGVGLGAVIIQDGKPVAFGSKTLSPAEIRYANIERELLAIFWGADKFHTCVYGRRVVVETNHRPLEAIFKKTFERSTTTITEDAVETDKI